MKRVLVSLFFVLLCSAGPLLAEDEDSVAPHDIRIIGGEYTLVYVYDIRAQELQRSCNCVTFIDEEKKVIFVLFPEQKCI
jgi:hypothetical protein